MIASAYHIASVPLAAKRSKPAPLLAAFISHAKADGKKARAIADSLESHGFKCWIAPRDVDAGQAYGDEIIKGIESARNFVLVLSKASNGSAFVAREVERAVSKKKKILAFRIANVEPAPSLELFISGTQWIDAFRGPLSTHIGRLANLLSKEHGAEPSEPDRKIRLGMTWVLGGTVTVALVALALSVAAVWLPSPWEIADKASPDSTLDPAVEKAIPGGNDPAKDIVKRVALTALATHGDTLPALEQSVADDRRLAAAENASAQSQRTLASDLNQIADLKLQSGDTAGALAASEESLAISRRLAAEDESDAQGLEDLASGLEKVGDAKLATGDLHAVLAYEESLMIHRKLAVQDITSSKEHRAISILLEKIGDARLAFKDTAGALAAYQESLAISRNFAVISDSSDSDSLSLIDVVVGLYKLAKVKTGDARNAALDEALEILDRLETEGKLTQEQTVWQIALTALRGGSNQEP